MTFEELKPGDMVEINSTKGQVVWKSAFDILLFGRRRHVKDVCLFIVATGSYRVIQLELTDTPFLDVCYFSRDRGNYGGGLQ